MLTFGSLSEESRSNGIQNDSIQNIVGNFGRCFQLKDTLPTGPFRYTKNGHNPFKFGNVVSETILSRYYEFNLSLSAKTSSETRSKNRKIRVYKRIA